MTEWCKVIFKETDDGFEMLVDEKCIKWLSRGKDHE